MTEIVKLKPEHLEAIIQHESMKDVRSGITDSALSALAASKYAYAMLEDGQPVACAGIFEFWSGRGEAWAFIIEGKPHLFLRLHRAVSAFLKDVPMRRIESTVRGSFLNGHRWAMMLGFECERYEMKGYGPTGEGYSAYALVKGVE